MQNQNNNSNSALENPKYLEMMDTYADKYADKAAYEEADITVWTRIMYVAIHAVIVLGTIALPQFITSISKGERIALTCFVAAIALCLEWFKGTYMERYFIAKMLSLNVMLGKDRRQMYHRKMNLNFKILAFFWFVSVALFCTTGVFYAKKYFVSGVELQADTSVKAALDASIASLNKSTAENAGSKALRQLNNSVAAAQTAWTTEQSRVDRVNATIKTDSEGDQWNYGIMALLCCILLELGLFAARGFHEKKQYEIACSLPNGDAEPKQKAKSDAPKAEKTAETTIIEEKLLALADVRIAALSAKLEEKNKLLKEFDVENKKFDSINAELINNLNAERRMTATLKSSLHDYHHGEGTLRVNLEDVKGDLEALMKDRTIWGIDDSGGNTSYFTKRDSVVGKTLRA